MRLARVTAVALLVVVVCLHAACSKVGAEAGKLEVESWLQGNTGMDGGRATVLVFWELWCPHCRSELPRVERLYRAYRGRGLNVVGLTGLTHGVGRKEATAFLRQAHVTYPVAKERGRTMSDRFGVSGIPSAVVVKNGKVVWEGHPGKLDAAMIEGWL